VATEAGVVNLRITRIDQWQRIQVTQTTGGPGHGHQRIVVRGDAGVGDVPAAGMAGRAITAAGRNTRLQRRYSRMTQGTVRQVGRNRGSVNHRTSIMTVQTRGRPAGNIAKSHVVNRTVDRQVLVRVTAQAVGRVGTQRNRINNFLTRTVMTGGAGTGAVGRNVVLYAFDLGPGRDDVTVATQLTWSLVGEIARIFCDGMGMGRMRRIKPASMTGRTVTTASKGLADCTADAATIDIVTAEAGVVNLHVRTIGQWRRIAVAGTTTGAGTTGAGYRHQRVMARDVRAVGQLPAALVTGRTVTTCREGLP